jgi:protein phosphatase
VNRYDQIEHAALTDVGIRRSHNQDSYTVLLASNQERWREEGHVFHVADGMGAHAVGELASEIATRIIAHTYHKYAAEGVVAALRKAFNEANTTIFERGTKNPEFAGMGTTSTALILRRDGAWIGHIGDSRAYRIRSGSLQQLSFDHSLLWEKAKRKHVRPEDLVGVPHNVIVRSLGPEGEVEPDIQGPHPVEDGDIFVLCSDGLSGPLTDREIGAVGSVLPPAEACEFLVDLANLRGGPDNITVIVVRIGAKSKAKARDDDEPVIKRRSLLSRIPWPLWILLLGVLLAGAAFGLIYNKLPGVNLAFGAAAITIVVGLICLGVYHVQQKNQPEEEPEYRPRTKVYRQSECRIDDALVAKLGNAEDVLVNRARELQWKVDWNRHQQHHDTAQELRTQGNFPAAFRETCRAMMPLTEALRKHRGKEEAFNPHWEKTEN